MLRLAVRALTITRYSSVGILSQKVTENASKFKIPFINHHNNLATFTNQKHFLNSSEQTTTKLCLLQNPSIVQISKNISRSLTKFSLQKGKRKTVKAVLKRFYRLNWGGWIRTKVGRKKKLWKKSEARKRRLKQHVFTNGTQSWLLDKMVTKYWRKPKYYVDDPYEPYQQREEFFVTRRKPMS